MPITAALRSGIFLCHLLTLLARNGISFFEYMRDRISRVGNIPSLGTIIRDKSDSNPFGWSWIPE